MNNTYKIRDFSGGFIDNKLNLNMPDNAFVEFTNVDFIENGGFKVRNGSCKVNDEAFPGNVTQLIEWRLKSGVTKTIVISEKKMYVLSSVHNTYEPVKYNGEDLTLKSDTVAYVFFKDYFYFTDGSKMYRWSDEVYYLHNLSTVNPYSFKKGDVIKLSVSKKESVFNGSSGYVVDINNNFVKKLRYQSRYIDATSPRERFTTVDNLKCKYVENNQIYGLDLTASFIKNNSYSLSCTLNNDTFTYKNTQNGKYENVPYFYYFSENFKKENEETYSDNIVNMWQNDWGRWYYIDFEIEAQFLNIGETDTYYRFLYDTDNFYPHNYNYTSNISYFGNPSASDENGQAVDSPFLEKIEGTEQGYNISEVKDVPGDILNCKFFCYHPMSFRFFASGNDFDPTAVYYSELQDFEKWQSKETEGSTDLILNTFYPRYNFGPLKGLITADNYVVGCYKNGFTTISGDVPEEYLFRNLSVPFGVESADSLVLIPNGLVFYSDGYIYYMSNSLLGSDYVKVPSQAELYSLSENKVDNTLFNSSGHKAVFYKNKYYLYFKDENNEDHILIYNFSRSSFLHYKDLSLDCLMVKDNLKLYGSIGKYVVSLFEDNCHTDFYEGAEQQIRFKVKSKFYDFSNDFSSYILKRFFLTTKYIDFSECDLSITEEKINSETGETEIVTIERSPDISISLQNDYMVYDPDTAFVKPENPSRIHGSELWKNSIFNCLWCTNPDYNISLFDANIPFSRIGFMIENSENSYFPLEFCVYDIAFDFIKGQNKVSHSYNNQKDTLELNYERR